MPTKKTLVFIAFVIVNLIWGAAVPILKGTLAYIPPITFLFFRLLIVCIIMLPYVMVEVRKIAVPVSDYLNLFLLGLMAQTSLILVFLSLKYTTSLDSTIIGATATIMAVYAGHYFYKEKISPTLTMGIGLATIGTFVVILGPLFMGADQSISVKERLIGNILSFLYNITWVIYIVWSKFSMGERSKMLKKTLGFINLKPMSQKYSPVFITTISFYVGAITVLPFMLVEHFTSGNGGFNILAIDAKGMWGLLYMVIFSSIIAYLLNQWTLDNAPISEATMFSYLGIIFSFPMAYFILGEIPDLFMLIGGGIIAFGVVIAETQNT